MKTEQVTAAKDLQPAKALAEIRDVCFPTDSDALRALIYEYVEWLDIDLSYQNFDQEMAGLESLFTLPSGCYSFAMIDGRVAGGVGFRTIDETTAEVKRLYVRPHYQGLQLGRQLMVYLLEKLNCLGYQRVVLDAVPPTAKAQLLYQQLGFYQIEPYFHNPVPDTKFYEYRF